MRLFSSAFFLYHDELLRKIDFFQYGNLELIRLYYCAQGEDMIHSIKFKTHIILGAVVIFTIIFCWVVLLQKSPVSNMDSIDQQVIIQKMNHSTKRDEAVHVQHDVQYHANQHNDQFEDRDEIQLIIMPEKQDEFFIVDRPIDEKDINLDSYSFVTMPISDDYEIDIETQQNLDILIGNDFNRFISLILQSNNDVVSKQACRSCVLYAFFKKVKKHHVLTTDDIIKLQHMIGNLYRFIETTKKLSKSMMITPEQYAALQDLNRPQALKNSMKLQARKTAAAAALKKLQSMSHR